MLIEMSSVSKHYDVGTVPVRALVDVSLQVEAGEDLAIVGASGSGKSTLLSILGCLDIASTGSYRLHGAEVSRQTRTTLAKTRSQDIGFIFQGFNLLSRATARENVELPLIYSGCSRTERRRRSMDLLAMVGLEDRFDHRPSQLSGGQQQRIAIARALANNPRLLLADEPTGALDQTTGRGILDLIHSLNRTGTTLILVTHDALAAARMSRIVTLVDGSVHSDCRPRSGNAPQQLAPA